MENKFWTHNCKDLGPTGTLKGEPCNWCDVTEEDIQMEELDKDCLYNPETV